MPTIIKEDGTGRTDSNSYATVAEADLFFDTHLYSQLWSVKDAENKARTMIMASRLIDQGFQFNGYKSNAQQSMQWPRMRCPDPDIDEPMPGLKFFPGRDYLDETKVPKAVLEATYQMALELLRGDRLKDVDSKGLRSFEVFQGIKLEFDSKDSRDIITDAIKMILAKYARSLDEKGGQAKLVRT